MQPKSVQKLTIDSSEANVGWSQKDPLNLKENTGVRTNGNKQTTELEMRFLLRGMKFWNSLPGEGLSSKTQLLSGQG